MNSSPTGTPVISPKVAPWAAALVALAGALATTLPQHTIAAQVSHYVLAIGGPILGILSPGMRR